MLDDSTPGRQVGLQASNKSKSEHLDVSFTRICDQYALCQALGRDRSCHFSSEEIEKLISDFNDNKVHTGLRHVLARFDSDHDGKLGQADLQHFLNERTHSDLQDSYARYAGYARVLAKASSKWVALNAKVSKTIKSFFHAIHNGRYVGYASEFARAWRLTRLTAELGEMLRAMSVVRQARALTKAFKLSVLTPDFGAALQPVLETRIVTVANFVGLAYILTDVSWEAYKLKERGYMSDDNRPMTMTQLVVERTSFQLVASVLVPHAIIHSAMHGSQKMFQKFGRYTRFGPSLVGLSVIPFLPMLDRSIEGIMERGFERYGPWAHHRCQQSSEDNIHYVGNVRVAKSDVIGQDHHGPKSFTDHKSSRVCAKKYESKED